ncbi:methyltransferase-like 26 [Ctenocephalides felis]|uniref:methyltransferase-like 26 n=1 Tax=Ctenocephalides felis TaxID=7515 RepID=UPI000E6E1355|nr:methyltransferase-like 26 [Ctenocephalides felis]
MKRTAAAAERNKEPILEVLKKYISNTAGYFLEISSGTGQHIAHFAPNFPNVTFQPSEYDKDMMCSIHVWGEECPTENVNPPLNIDVTQHWTKWPQSPMFIKNNIDYIYNANMIHISPISCTEGLFSNSGELLKPDGLLITYGPYGQNGVISPESNVRFDEGLRMQNPEWGVRDINLLKQMAERHGIWLSEIIGMPANNKVLIWKRNNGKEL